VLKVKNVNYLPTRRLPVCVVRPRRSATQIRGWDVESRKRQFACRHEVWNPLITIGPALASLPIVKATGQNSVGNGRSISAFGAVDA